MSAQVQPINVTFPDWFDERAEFEHRSKGFLPDVDVRLNDGTRYRLYFIDPIRLAQDLEAEAETGRPYFAEANMVVIPMIRAEAIRLAIAGLFAEGFFSKLRPQN